MVVLDGLREVFANLNDSVILLRNTVTGHGGDWVDGWIQ